MTSRHIVVTGASGFVGSRIARRLLRDARFTGDRITLTDLVRDNPPIAGGSRFVEGDLKDSHTRDEVIGEGVDILLHLAAVMGGAAEANPALARQVNIDTTLDFLEALHDEARPPRVVFASSIAVFGPPLPDFVQDDTLPQPHMVYGAQKRMIEVAVEHATARGWIDGFALRLPGIVARKDADSRLKSAFLNLMFYDYEAGRDITLPVSADGTTWLISVPACVEAFLHAATLPAGVAGRRRAFTLPTQRVRIGDLIGELSRRFPESATTVRYEPDSSLEAQFATQPAVSTEIADALGFRHDGSIEALVRNAFEAQVV